MQEKRNSNAFAIYLRPPCTNWSIYCKFWPKNVTNSMVTVFFFAGWCSGNSFNWLGVLWSIELNRHITPMGNASVLIPNKKASFGKFTFWCSWSWCEYLDEYWRIRDWYIYIYIRYAEIYWLKGFRWVDWNKPHSLCPLSSCITTNVLSLPQRCSKGSYMPHIETSVIQLLSQCYQGDFLTIMDVVICKCLLKS